MRRLAIVLSAFWSMHAMSLPIDIDTLVLTQPESVGMSSAQLDKLDDVVLQAIKKSQIEGAVVAVSRRGEPVYFSAHGTSNPKTGAPMRKDNLFVMMSSTKPVTGVAAMIAVEQGLFDPSDPVHKYIPGFKDIQVAVLKTPQDRDVSPAYVFASQNGEVNFLKRMADNIVAKFTDGYMWHIPEYRTVAVNRPITIHDLLTHTSGLGSYGLGNATSDWGREIWDKAKFSANNHTLESYIDTVTKGPLDFQPGTRWTYSPLIGLDVVARIIEITSGKPFDRFVQEHIFNPLDMRDTHWLHALPVEKKSRLVTLVYDERKTGKKADSIEVDKSRYVSGSVGLVSTARDYLHFENMLVNKGTLFGQRVLKESSVRKMSTNYVGDLFGQSGKGEGEGFGYSVSITLDPERVKLQRSKGAFGWAGAFGTISWSEPATELSVVVMVQQPTKDFSYAIAKAVSQALTDR